MFRINKKLLPSFKGFSFSAMLSVYMKCRFSLSYRDLEEIMSIRGAKIDHATLQSGLSPLID
ncbi:transposase [Wolbachia pipientis wAus]